MLRVRNEEDVVRVLDGIMRDVFPNKMQELDKLLEVLEEAPQGFAVVGLRFLLKNFLSVPKNGSLAFGKDMKYEDFSLVAQKIGPNLIFLFHGLVSRNISESDMASQLWNSIQEHKSRRQRLVALSLILFDQYVPYCQIGDLTGLSFVMADADVLAMDKDFNEKQIPDSMLAHNIINRLRMNRQTAAKLWVLIHSQGSEAANFLFFCRSLQIHEDRLVSASTSDWESITQKIYA